MMLRMVFLVKLGILMARAVLHVQHNSIWIAIMHAFESNARNCFFS